MTLHIIRGAALLAALALVATTNAQPPLPPPTPVPEKQDAKKDDPDQPEPGIKVAEKGPIHEAFAQPGAETRGKGMTAPKAPPEPIPELPPDTKPDGANVKWVSGYWHWDADKGDFIWISGFWRNFPPGRAWQAGSWIEKNGSWMYTPGFWRPVDMNNWRIDLPEPPKTVEGGPSTPPDNPDAVWVPGAWEYRNERFVWRAGYWAHPNDNQVWQPGQYLATGSGYSYAPGYWDYPLEDRGLLYAPVYFTEPLWQTPGWCYRPRFAFGLGYGGWGTGGLFSSLFYGPGFNNYYYGNYYNPWYTGGWGGFGSPFWNPVFGIGFGFGSAFGGWGGYYPWWGASRGYYNPLWNHYCWLNRGNPNWAGSVRNAGVARAIGAAPRPQAVATNVSAGRPIRVSPIGGAVQTAVRTAAKSTAPQPLIQPASQVARSLQTGRANPNPANVTGSPRIGGGGDVRPRVNGNATAGAGRPIQVAPPTHAGSVQITPGGSRADVPAGGIAGQPTIRSGGGDRIERNPNLPIRPDGGAATRPTTPNLPNLPNTSAPEIRSGTLPGNSLPGRPVIGGGGERPIAPQIRPSAPSLPQVRPSAPSAPVIRPSAPSVPSRPSGPGMRPSGGNSGGGRSIQVSPGGGGRPIGGGGGARPGGGGGGGRPGGGKR